MSKFGWSYPPGCSGPPDDFWPYTKLQEEVLGLLEDAGMPEEISDKIVLMIDEWERMEEAGAEAIFMAEYEATSEEEVY